MPSGACGSSPPIQCHRRVNTASIEALPLEQIEALAEALIDFQGPADLAAWLDAHS